MATVAIAVSVAGSACAPPPVPLTHSTVTGEQSQRRPVVIVRGWGFTDRCLSHTDWPSDTGAAAWALDWFDGRSYSRPSRS